MAKDYGIIARSVLEKLGGAENVVALTHCMTRLRFLLSDESKIDAEALKGIKGVMGVVHNGDKCQVIIGNNVSYAYKEVMALCNLSSSESSEPEKKVKLTPKVIGAKILDALVGTMSPLIPAIIGGSMVKLLAMVLKMTGLLDDDSSTLIILNAIGDGAFFFLPVMVAASASIKFKTNMSLSIAIAGVLIHPNFMELMAQAADGKHVDFFSIPITSVKYTYTVIPVLVMTWALSYIERWVDSITPAVTKNFLKPMLIVLIAAPLAIVLIGPLGIWIGTALSALVYTIHSTLGWLSVAIMGALWPLLVLTGMHRVFTPTIIQTIAETGREGMVMPSEIGANIGMGGACLAVAWKTKNRELKQTASAAGASAIFAGISEPALYGVLVRLKRPLIATMITGFIVGALAGMAGLASHSMAAPSLFTSVQFFDVNDPMSIAWVFGLIALSIVLSFALTLILGFEDIPNDEDEEGEAIANKDVANKEKAEEQETVLEPAKPASV
ncbi:PTS cellobiose/arbutin/salicin transporter subunit IIBC [Vibrio owensii]|uniref:PTS cellobiose/arbutin/salicin transporter subunit IIBC n=1 Tax=Vibrio owensii TaxID=696485 RepID=UPI0003A47A25|nr:PTS cellobiose/arbutin/salicin transporter subunit IIBC [Vibrio owensii]